jgi:hypothetical protein
MAPPPLLLRGAWTAALLAGCGGEAFTAGDGGTADGGEPDSTVVGDGGSEAGDAGQSWCKTLGSAATFCEDFDEYADFAAFTNAWSGFSMAGGTLSFTPIAGVPSPPNALSAASTQTSHVNAIALRLMPTSKTRPVSRRLEFALYPGQATGIAEGSVAAIAAIMFGQTVASGAVAITFGPGPGTGATLGAAYVEPSAGSGVPGFASQASNEAFPNLGSWDGRLALEIDYGSDAGVATACVEVFLGGIPQLSPCLPLPEDLIESQTVYIALGILSSGLDTNTGTVSLAFDNVTYTQL